MRYLIVSKRAGGWGWDARKEEKVVYLLVLASNEDLTPNGVT